MRITVSIENTYVDDTTMSVATVDVADPGGMTLDDWANIELFSLTGTGRGSDEPAFYEVEIIECNDRPELVGQKFEWG